MNNKHITLSLQLTDDILAVYTCTRKEKYSLKIRYFFLIYFLFFNVNIIMKSYLYFCNNYLFFKIY